MAEVQRILRDEDKNGEADFAQIWYHLSVAVVQNLKEFGVDDVAGAREIRASSSSMSPTRFLRLVCASLVAAT